MEVKKKKREKRKIKTSLHLNVFSDQESRLLESFCVLRNRFTSFFVGETKRKTILAVFLWLIFLSRKHCHENWKSDIRFNGLLIVLSKYKKKKKWDKRWRETRCKLLRNFLEKKVKNLRGSKKISPENNREMRDGIRFRFERLVARSKTFSLANVKFTVFFKRILWPNS